MSQSQLGYQVKNIGYHLQKAADTGLAHTAVTLLSASVLPFLAIQGNISADDIDTTGADNAAVVMAELTEQKNDLLENVMAHQKLTGDQAAYEQLGQRDQVLALADDVMAAEYSLKDQAKTFFGNLYTNGGADGLAISETDFQALLQDIDQQDDDFDWENINENIPSLLEAANVAEHLDESRSEHSISATSDINSSFENAVSIANKAKAQDENGADAIGLSIVVGSWFPGLLMGIFFSVLRRDVFWNARKPEKPKPKPAH